MSVLRLDAVKEGYCATIDGTHRLVWLVVKQPGDGYTLARPWLRAEFNWGAVSRLGGGTPVAMVSEQPMPERAA